LETQTIPSLDRFWRNFGWNEPVFSPRYTLTTPQGGSVIAFVTNEGVRVEGAHTRPGSPLLIIVNEAKSVEDKIFEGIDRCTPDALMLISSPGWRTGRFYQCFKELRPFYTCINAGLADCPHISQERIDHTIATYGIDHPVTRSTLFGEFMSQADGQQFVCTTEEVTSCLDFPPTWKPGFKCGFFDFAEGRAANVLCVRNGNKYDIVDSWRDTNEDAVVGRALYLIKKHGLDQKQVWADAAAKSILDKMATSGCSVNRQNFGATDPSGIYKSWVAKAWLEGASKIKSREVIIPNRAELLAQITNRLKVFAPTGKLGVEDKWIMKKERNVDSPDEGDVLFGAMAVHDDHLDVKPEFLDLSDLQYHSPNSRQLASVAGL
jgi:hypothetical protein